MCDRAVAIEKEFLDSFKEASLEERRGYLEVMLGMSRAEFEKYAPGAPWGGPMRLTPELRKYFMA
jgi:hypothetical protein